MATVPVSEVKSNARESRYVVQYVRKTMIDY